MIDKRWRDAFLKSTGWGGAKILPMTGDASSRSYFRLEKGGGASTILMDASGVDRAENERFFRVARWLRASGLSAPEIGHVDFDHGLLLVEDLGDALLSRLVAEDPESEIALYTEAARLLAALHKLEAPEFLAAYSPSAMADALEPFFEHASPFRDAQSELRVKAAMQSALREHASDRQVVILRDCHAENLLYLPDRSSPANIGLLDFQDALAGDPTYDLVSLLEDARRDVSAEARNAAVTAFVRETGHDRDRLEASMAAQGLQRHLRILGIFSRLCGQGKPRYLDLVPRVARQARAALEHRANARVAEAMRPWRRFLDQQASQ